MRGAGPRGARRVPVGVGWLLALAIIGAVVGAALQAAPSQRFLAEAIIAVQPDVGSAGASLSHRDQWQTAADASMLPSVLLSAAGATGSANPGLPSLQKRVTIAGAPGSTLLRVRARDRSPAAARALADAVARETVRFLRDVNLGNLRAVARRQVFSFEAGLNGWSARDSVFAAPPVAVSRQLFVARVGRNSIRIKCGAVSSCGAHVRARSRFTGGSDYRATAYMRGAQPGIRVRLALGSSPRDVTAGPFVSLPTDRWQLLSVLWTPRADSTRAELATQTAARGLAGTMFLDVATLGPDLRHVDERTRAAADDASVAVRARRAAAGDRYSVVATASSAGEIGSDTIAWTAAGSLVGLLVGAAGLTGAQVARRRQHA